MGENKHDDGTSPRKLGLMRQACCNPALQGADKRRAKAKGGGGAVE